jgi:hypothetical protein
LEAEASEGKGLKYIGGQAIRTRLKDKGIQPLPWAQFTDPVHTGCSFASVILGNPPDSQTSG